MHNVGNGQLGRILWLSDEGNNGPSGVIRTDDGRQYRFSEGDVIDRTGRVTSDTLYQMLDAGTQVLFEVDPNLPTHALYVEFPNGLPNGG